LKFKVFDFHYSAALRLFSAFGIFLSLFVVVMAQICADSAQGRCLAGGRFTPFLMIAASATISRKKEHTHRIHGR